MSLVLKMDENVAFPVVNDDENCLIHLNRVNFYVGTENAYFHEFGFIIVS